MFGITCVFLLRVRIGMVATMFGDFFKTVSFFAVLLRLVIDVHWIPFGFRKKTWCTWGCTAQLQSFVEYKSMVDRSSLHDQPTVFVLFVLSKKTICFGR
jgi:hypothetical protein